MTTLSQLAADGKIVRIEVPLEDADVPARLHYGTPGFVKWLRGHQSDKEKSPSGADQTPAEQLDWLLYRFTIGLPLIHIKDYRVLRHEIRPVWELKTVDLRIFGWFAQRDCFISVFGDWADKVKDFDLYRGYRLEVRRIRREWGVDQALCVEGEFPDDVLSL